MTDRLRTRRSMLKAAGIIATGAPLAILAGYGTRAAKADDRPHAEDGHALDYVNDAADAAGHDRYTEGARCQDCAFWAGHVDGSWGGCNHPNLSDVLVNQDGWCEAFAPG